jgi:peptidoglycan lytic transglycosylase G
VKKAYLLAALAAVILVTWIAVATVSMVMATPAESFSEPVVITFAPGTSSRSMAAELKSNGVIRSQWSFMLLRAVRPRANLLAGEYQFEQPVSALRAFQKISRGEVLYHAITVPEGLNRFEVAEAVAKSGLVDRGQFLKITADPGRIAAGFPQAKSLEGFLFPETYYLSRPVTAEKVVDMMIGRFKKVFAEATHGADTSLRPYDLVTLASLVEKETSLPGEQGLVSSVFHNRLRIGMPLQCDPTVIYGLMLQRRYQGRLYTTDLQDPHEYNTYVHGGLPPGPIASPGRGAMEAAARPAESGYLYFVAQARGGAGHVFSKSLAEHNQAVAAYRKTQ